MSRRTPGRATRQILSGAQLSPSRGTVGGREPNRDAISPILGYFIALAVLIILSALIWAIWGMGPASVVLFILAIALVASWVVI